MRLACGAWLAGGVLLAWPIIASILTPKLFPGLFSKLPLETIEQRNRKGLARYRDELDRSTAVALEQAKGEITGSYATLKSSMDFLSTNQSELRAHSVEAVNTLWRVMLDIREAYSSLIVFEHVFRVRERQDALAQKDHVRILRFVSDYEYQETITARDQPFLVVDFERHRPFCGEKLWLIFFIFRRIYLRCGYLTGQSLASRKYTPLIEDRGIVQLLRAVVSEELIKQAQHDEFNGLASAIGQIKGDFLKEAARVMSGSKAVAESLSDAQATQHLHTREVAEVIRERTASW